MGDWEGVVRAELRALVRTCARPAPPASDEVATGSESDGGDRDWCDACATDDVACSEFITYIDEHAAGDASRLDFLARAEAQLVLRRGITHVDPSVACTSLQVVSRVVGSREAARALLAEPMASARRRQDSARRALLPSAIHRVDLYTVGAAKEFYYLSNRARTWVDRRTVLRQDYTRNTIVKCALCCCRSNPVEPEQCADEND